MRKVHAGRWVALLSAPALAWGASETASAQTLVPERIAAVQVPLSTAGDIALMSDETAACVIDSYEVRVRCVDRSGEVVGVFGREGEGPGEFSWLANLVGGPDNTLGTIDHRLNRFSVFEPSGILVSEVLLPGEAFFMVPAGRFSAALTGVAIVTYDPDLIEAGAGTAGRDALFKVDVASGVVVREEVPPVDAEVECGEIIYALPNPEGGWAYVACEGHMVFVGEDGDAAVLQAPTYTGELPNHRDIAELEEANSGTQRFGGLWDREELERIRNTPKNYHLLFGQERFDDRGRLWIATQRDRDVFSYLDVYDPAEAEFVGSVRVSDRIDGFDLLGSTLVVVVERQLPPDDPDGIPARAVDWYDVSGWR